MSSCRVKICGITDERDAEAAVHAGADALGFVFAPSPRKVATLRAKSIIGALPPLVSTVGVFVNESSERIRETISLCGLHYVQFHGDEGPEFCNAFGGSAIKAVRIRDEGSLSGLDRFDVCAFLLDGHEEGKAGGTGKAFPWDLAVKAKIPGRVIILAGGLTVDNIVEAVHTVKPFAVDVSSGVENEPGKKDHKLLKNFIRLAKSVEW